MSDITIDQLKEALPSNLKSSATVDLQTKLNKITTDPIYANHIKENFLSYSMILREGKFKLDDYLNAIAYVSFKLMGYNNQEAYFRTFPDRYSSLVASGKSSKDIAAYVSAFHKGKLVNLIMEQSIVPTWILNQDAYQRAINTQVELMTDAKSERVRAMAADSILNHLKKPESVAPLINIDMRQGSGLEELKDAIVKLAQTQKDLIQKGTPTKKIAEHKIFEVEDV